MRAAAARLFRGGEGGGGVTGSAMADSIRSAPPVDKQSVRKVRPAPSFESRPPLGNSVRRRREMNIWAGIGVLAAMAAAGGAEAPVSWSVSIGPAATGGSIAYEIGGRLTEADASEELPFPISRLEWPLDAIGLHGELRLRLPLGWEAWVWGGWIPSSDAGSLEDSDWEYPEGRRVLAIHSQSDAVLESWTLDAGVRWWFWRSKRPGGAQLSAGLGAGWMRQSFAWEGRDGVQTYPATPEIPTDSWTGKAIDYELDADIPYLEAAVRLRWPRVEIEGRIAGSAWARAGDRDDHRLRGIVAEADTRGAALLADAAVRYDLTDAWFLRLRVRHLAIAADGSSHNRVDGGDDPDLPPGMRWSIEEEIRGAATSLHVAIGRDF